MQSGLADKLVPCARALALLSARLSLLCNKNCEFGEDPPLNSSHVPTEREQQPYARSAFRPDVWYMSEGSQSTWSCANLQ